MCGRFAMNSETNALLEEIVNAHGASAIHDWQKYWPPNYNVAPTQQVPVAAEKDGERMVQAVRWGMVAPYAKDLRGKPVINARIETVTTNGMFKRAFEEHRVIVPALGYYEWQHRADGKQPFFVKLPDDQPLAFAGIVRTWRDPDKTAGDPQRDVRTMAIITMDAHTVPGEVHDREPAMLLPDAADDWLGDHLTTDQRIQLLLSCADAIADELVFYEVTRDVNASVRGGQPNSRPDYIQPL